MYVLEAVAVTIIRTMQDDITMMCCNSPADEPAKENTASLMTMYLACLCLQKTWETLCAFQYKSDMNQS